MSKKQKQTIPQWAATGHARPVTRRDFLASGLIPFSAALFAPQWLSLLLGAEAAAETAINGKCPEPETGMPAVFVVNLAGGAALSGNFMPHRMDGGKLPSYSKMGMGSNPGIVTGFNGAKFHTASQFLAGVNAAAAQATRDKVNFLGVCAKSQDDTAANKLAIEGLVTKAGLVGSYLAHLDRRVGGFRHSPAVISPPAPLSIARLEDIRNSIGYAGAMNNQLTAAQKAKLAGLIKNLSESQARRLMASSSGEQIKNVVECAGIKNVELNSGSAAGIDTPADVNTLWTADPGVGGATIVTAANLAIFGAIAHNVLEGNAGCGTLSLGGYDYHDNTRTTGDRLDREAGIIVGRLLQTAALKNKKVFIYVASDGSAGSVDSSAGDANWVTDRGDAGCNYVLAFDPAGRHASTGTQLGGFTDGQTADATHLVGNNAELAAVAVFANYMSFANQTSRFESVAPGRFTTAQYDEVTKIKS